MYTLLADQQCVPSLLYAQITGVSILRAGETMEQALTAVCKDIRLGKILIQTNHDTGEPEVSAAARVGIPLWALLGPAHPRGCSPLCPVGVGRPGGPCRDPCTSRSCTTCGCPRRSVRTTSS